MRNTQYIVIYQIQYYGFMRTRDRFADYFSEKSIDAIPVMIKPDLDKGNRWILPAILLINPDFEPVATHLNSARALDNLEIRHIDPSELIEYEFPNNT